MKLINTKNLFSSLFGDISSPIKLFVEEPQPYWYLVSKGMTKSSTTVVLIVLLILLLILLSLIMWDRYTKKNNKEKIDTINWNHFNDLVEEKKLSQDNIKLLKEIIITCKVENPERIYKEVPFLEYKLDEYMQKKVKQENIPNVLIKNHNVAKLNNVLTDSIKDIKESFDFFYRGQSIPDVSSRQLRVSSKVYVRVDKYAKSIETKVRNNTVMYFSIESSGLLVNHLSAGETVDLFYERDGQYRMKLRVLEVNEFEIKLLHSVDMKRTQKRSFVRYETKLGIRFKFASRTLIKMTSEIFAGNIVDISGGGIKFNSREEISKDDTIIAFGMWDEVELKFKAKVLRVDQIETKNGIVYVGYCIFLNMDKQFVDKIVRKIFSEIAKDLNKNVQ